MKYSKYLLTGILSVGFAVTLTSATVHAEDKDALDTSSIVALEVTENRTESNNSTITTEVAELKNGWYQEESYWYYYENDIYIQDEYRWLLNLDYELGYYYFDYDGHMVTNEWRSPDGYNRYYFTENGKAASGKYAINGINYLFSDGHPNLLINYKGIVGSFYYETNDEGVIIVEKEVEGKGWIKIQDRWAYLQEDGTFIKDRWYEENGIWYYFDTEGLTIVNDSITFYNEEAQENDTYFFDEYGHMMTNQWIQDNYSYYYVSSDGKAAGGEFTINGKNYLFEKWSNILLTSYSGFQNNTYYETNVSGEITYKIEVEKPGWAKVKDSWVYLQENGQFKNNEWYQENGIWYYFGYDGFIYTGLKDVYDKVTGVGNTYYFDQNGHMLTNYWYLDAYENVYTWVYFGSNGKAVSGLNTINGAKYIFNDYGRTEPNIQTVIDGVFYETNINGKVINEYVLKQNSWELLGGKWYYFGSDGKPYSGLKEINGNTYYFYDNGEMSTGYEFIDGLGYRAFDENGHMIKNGWYMVDSAPVIFWYYFDEDGAPYNGWLNKTYYIDYGRMCTGIQYIDDVAHLFDANGHWISKIDYQEGWNLINGYYYYIQNNELVYAWQKIDGSWYYFDGLGRMLSNQIEDIDAQGEAYYFQSNGKYVINGWYNYYGEYVYAEADGKLAKDWQKINGVWYYFDSQNYMVNYNTIIDNEYHLFASNGQWLGKKPLDGWVKNYSWSYYKDGKLLHGWQYLDGKYYYFNIYDGYAFQNEILSIDNELFYFMDNCAMASSSGWLKTIDGEYVYLNSNHRVVTGWQKVNGVWYYLEPLMATGIRFIEGEYHLFAENGAWQGRINPQDGWYKYNGNKYAYFQNGSMLQNQWLKLGGNYYNFNYTGEMMTGLVSSMFSIAGGNLHYLDNSGKLVCSQWVKIGEKWIYCDEAGRIKPNVTLIIDGKKYSFDEYGFMI